MDFLSHSPSAHHEKILMKISQKLELNNININKDILFEKITQKLSESDNSIMHLKNLIKGNINKNQNQLGMPMSNNPHNKEEFLRQNHEQQTHQKKGGESHLSVHINKHQITSNKSNMNKKVSLANLMQWAHSNKIHLRKMHLNINNNFDMAKTDEKTNRNSLIFNVPNAFIISSDMEKISEECEEIRKVKELKDEADFICLSIGLRKLRKDKKFKDYISYLFDSVKFSNYPLFYNKSELNELKGSYLETLINARRSLFKLQFSLLKNKKIFDPEYTEEDYFKSRTIVNSKFFNVKIQGRKVPVLIPLADIFYSKSQKSNVELTQTKNSIQLKNIETINKKSPVQLSIGKASNYHYLVNYGFSMINNQMPLDIYLDLKIKNANGDKKNKEILLSNDFNINNALIILRKTVSKLINEKRKIKNFDNPKNIDNEYESLRVFKGGLKSQISNYSTKINQDISKLAKTKNHNEINLLNILIEEKKVI